MYIYISKYLSYMCLSKNTSGIYLGYYNNLNLTKEMNKKNVIIYQIYKKKKKKRQDTNYNFAF